MSIEKKIFELRKIQARYEHSGYHRFMESFTPELRKYGHMLACAGFEHYIPMLDKRVEGTVLNGLGDILSNTLNLHEISPFAGERSPDDMMNIKLEVIRKTQEKLQSVGLNTKLLPTIKIIPPEDLNGICTSRGESAGRLTDFGKMVSILKDKWPDLSIFLYHGRARDAAGTRPEYRIKNNYKKKTIRIPNLQYLARQSGDLPSDFDFLAVHSGQSKNIFPFSIQDMKQKLEKTVFRSGNGGAVSYKTSSRRSGFNRLELHGRGWHYLDENRTLIKVPRTSFGHIFFPAFEEKYSVENRLLPFLMESARIDIPVMLVPQKNKEGKTISLWGVAIDFFGGYLDVAGKRLRDQKWMEREFSIAKYPFPELTFSLDHIQQTIFNIGYALRTWPWDDKHPAMLGYNLKLSEKELDSVKNLPRIAKETQQYFTESVIHPLSKIFQEEPSKLGTESQRAEFGISLLEDIKLAMEGDPIATILRLLPAGMQFTRSERAYFDAFIDIYGLGFLDINGFFPEIGNLLTNKEVVKDLKSYIFRYIEDKARTENNLADRGRITKKGLLFDYIFKLAEGDAQKMWDLFRPVWCSTTEWHKAIKKNENRVRNIDYRFKPYEEREPLSTRLAELLYSAQKPLAIRELVELLENVSSASILTALRGLANSGAIVRLGGDRARNATEGGLGTGGYMNTFCTPDTINKLVEDGTIYKYLSPEEGAKKLFIEGNIMSATDLKLHLKVNDLVVREIIHRLSQNGEIELVGKLNRHQLWRATIIRDLKN